MQQHSAQTGGLLRHIEKPTQHEESRQLEMQKMHKPREIPERKRTGKREGGKDGEQREKKVFDL